MVIGAPFVLPLSSLMPPAGTKSVEPAGMLNAELALNGAPSSSPLTLHATGLRARHL